MNKASVCNNCATKFSYDPSDRSGKYCTHACYITHKISNRRHEYRIVNGNKQITYQINCLYCGSSKDAVRKTAKYCSSSCQLKYEYEHNTRDRTATTDKAHETVRLYGFPQRRGKPVPWLNTPEVNAKVSKTKTGKPVPLLRGANNANWKGGKDKSIWKTPEYQAWRKAVMRRDKYTCVFCGDNAGGNLEADHIKPRVLFPELTFDLANGRTLCKQCHQKTPSWGHNVHKLTRDDFGLAG